MKNNNGSNTFDPSKIVKSFPSNKDEESTCLPLKILQSSEAPENVLGISKQNTVTLADLMGFMNNTLTSVILRFKTLNFRQIAFLIIFSYVRFLQLKFYTQGKKLPEPINDLKFEDATGKFFLIQVPCCSKF